MTDLLSRCLPMFAARGGDADPAITLIGIVVLVVVGIIIAVREAGARYDVISKGSVPYCPRCNRQVSFRRDCCRSCGYQFKTYGGSSLPVPAPAAPPDYRRRMATDLEREGRAVRKREEERIELGIKLADDEANRLAYNAGVQAKKDAWYRSRGVEPGSRWAWFKVLPDMVQILIVAALMTAPALAVLIAVARR